MVVRTRIDSIAQDIELLVSDTLSPAAQGKAVADFARSSIGKADDANKRVLGRVPPRTITVDGSRGAALESVKPSGGQIIVEWELVTDVLIWIGQTLRDRSPVLSGRYRDAHTLFADGVEVPRGQNIPEATTYTFANLVPYARRIEVGKTESGRDFVIQVPNRIYERTANDAKARFGNIAQIKSDHVALTGAYQLKQNQKYRSFTGRGRSGGAQRADRVKGSAIQVPAITVSLKAA